MEKKEVSTPVHIPIPNNYAQFNTNINIHQLQLSPDELEKYNKAYPGAAKDVVDMLRVIIEAQRDVDNFKSENDKLIIKNQGKHLSNKSIKDILGFLLSISAFIFCGFLVIKGFAITGIILALGICISAFNVKPLEYITKFFKNKTDKD